MSNTVSLEEIPYSPDSCDLFDRLRELPGAALLDSSFPHSQCGRYDILCALPEMPPPAPATRDTQSAWFNYYDELTHFHREYYGDVQPASQDIPFSGGLLGMVGYDCGNALNHVSDAPQPTRYSGARLGAYSWAVVQDHLLQRSVLAAQPSVSAATRSDLLSRLRSRSVVETPSFVLTAPFVSNI